GVPGWETALRNVQMGAERGYGWGRLAMVSDLSQGVQDDPLHLSIPKGQPIEAHADAGMAAGKISGPVEPLLGWERNNAGGSSWRVSNPRVCYEPGSILTGQD